MSYTVALYVTAKGLFDEGIIDPSAKQITMKRTPHPHSAEIRHTRSYLCYLRKYFDKDPEWKHNVVPVSKFYYDTGKYLLKNNDLKLKDAERCVAGPKGGAVYGLYFVVSPKDPIWLAYERANQASASAKVNHSLNRVVREVEEGRFGFLEGASMIVKTLENAKPTKRIPGDSHDDDDDWDKLPA